MAPIDLLPPPSWRGEGFPFGEKQMKDLQRYIASAISLPITLEDCQQDLCLDRADIDEATMVSIIEIYASIREHCLNFKSNIFPEIVDLALNLSNFAGSVNVYYPSLFQAVDYLTRPNDGQQSNYMNMILGIVIRDKGEQLVGMNELGRKITSGLRELESVLVSDRSNLEQRRWMLDAKLATGRSSIADLKQQIETLNHISQMQAAHSDDEEETYRVPLVGFLPPSVFLNNPNGRAATTYIYNYLSPFYGTHPGRSPLYALELLRLQVDLVIRELVQISDLIKSGIDTIRNLCEPLQSLADALNGLPERMKSQRGLRVRDLLYGNLEALVAEWSALEQRARLYAQNAWVNPVGANMLL